MRKLLILFAALALIGSAMGQGTWYPGGVLNSIAGKNPAGSIAVQTITTPTAANTTQIYNDLSCNTTASKNATQLIAAGYDPTPDVARGISIAPSASFTGDIYFNGTDIAGSSISEKVSWSSSSATKSTTKAFASITSLNATTDAAKTFDLGYNDLLGLNTLLATNTVLLTALANTKESTAATVTVSSTVLSQNTVDLNSVLNGGTVKVWYIV